MIIDSHRHLVKSDTESFRESVAIFLSDMKSNSIEKSVVIADNLSDSNTANTKTLIDIFSGNDSVCIIGAINPSQNLSDQEEYFEKLLREKYIIGLKLFNGFDKIFPTDKKCFLTYKLAQKYNVPVIFHTGINIDDNESAKFNDPKYIVEIANKFPRVSFLISHFYWPEVEYCLEITKGVKNIFLDTTVLAEPEAVELIGKENISKTLEEAISLKPNKVIFGSDYPSCETRRAIDLICELNVSKSQKDKVFAENSIDLFNI
jgi:hypothetical protein